MSRAILLSDVGLVMTLDFARLPVIALGGVMFYAEAFDIAIIMGAALILLGNWFNLYRRPLAETYNSCTKSDTHVTGPKVL